MTTTTRSAPAGARRSADTAAGRPLRTWRTAVGLTALAGGAAVVAGCLLPWATAFAGLVEIPGIRGSNGKLLAVAGVLIVAAGAGHLIRGDAVTRWLIGLLGTAAAGYSGYLLLRLAGSLRSGIGDSMLLVRGGPGLWVVAGGGLLGLGTMFFPASSQSGWRALRADGASLAAWAADRTSAGPRRWLQLALGLVWLLDAALQFQPFMFTRGFVTRVIDPAAMGSPGVISRSVMGTGQLVLTHPALFNAAFATIQLALAAGLLWRRTTRLALAGTIVWALGVWWLGEGLGGLLTCTASPVTGAPGAALLYVVIAVLAWPRRADRGHQGPAASTASTASTGSTGSTADGSPAGPRTARLAWAVLWAGSAALVLATPAASGGTLASAGLAVLFVIIAAGIFIPAATRPVLILAAVAAVLMWALGQDFGAMFTGSGTDPGTGPLLLLLTAAYWPLRRAAQPRAQPQADRAGQSFLATSGSVMRSSNGSVARHDAQR
jgi:hypothetical protein